MCRLISLHKHFKFVPVAYLVGLRALTQGGLKALESAKKKKHKGRKILTDDEEELLCQKVLSTQPGDHGFSVILWTRKLVAMLVEKLFNKKISEKTAEKIMRCHNMSPQKPIRRAYQRDDAEVTFWQEKTFPEIQAKAKSEGARIFWLDEASIRSDHAYGTTWGSVGETPIVSANGNVQRINVVGIIEESGFLDVKAFDERMNSVTFCNYLEELCEKIDGKIVIILDNASYHKSKAVYEYLAKKTDKLQLENLPKYAPDMNPMELTWSLLKTRELNKRSAKNKSEFISLANSQIEELKEKPQKCAALFGKKELAYIREAQMVA
jgi:transposase